MVFRKKTKRRVSTRLTKQINRMKAAGSAWRKLSSAERGKRSWKAFVKAFLKD